VSEQGVSAASGLRRMPRLQRALRPPEQRSVVKPPLPGRSLELHRHDALQRLRRGADNAADEHAENQSAEKVFLRLRCCGERGPDETTDRRASCQAIRRLRRLASEAESHDPLRREELRTKLRDTNSHREDRICPWLDELRDVRISSTSSTNASR
jgi:hypothetical protein